MPVHDWTCANAGDFHHFHQMWSVNITNALNGGLLPPEFMAMIEQVTGRPIPDVVTLQSGGRPSNPGGVTVRPAPSARVVQRFERATYTRRKNRVVIRHGRGRVVAIIEIVSPGNKDSRHAIRAFAEKAADVLSQGVNLLVVDLFPPMPRDPEGIHKVILDEFSDEPFEFLPDKPLSIASYLGGDQPAAFVETIGVGDPLPSMPIFLTDDEEYYVPAPLEATYQEAWAVYPAPLKALVAPPELSFQGVSSMPSA